MKQTQHFDITAGSEYEIHFRKFSLLKKKPWKDLECVCSTYISVLNFKL